MHRQAMQHAQNAHLALDNGDEKSALHLFEQAYELEHDVAMSYLNSDKEPTRSIVFRSAAVLANKCKKFREAEKMINLGLAGNPPEEIAEEMRIIYEDINFYRHLRLHNTELDSSEIQLSISGKGVGYGIVNSEEFLNRFQIIEQLTYRTAERILGKEYRIKGAVAKDIKEKFEPYLSTPMAASFAVKIRVGKPTFTSSLFPNEIYQEVIDELINDLEILNCANETLLNNKIADSSYYQNFVSLAKGLAPDGEIIGQVGLTVVRGNKEKFVAIKRTQKDILERLSNDFVLKNKEEKIFEVQGSILNTDDYYKTLTIETQSNDHIVVTVPDGLSDIVRIYWNDPVKATIAENSQTKQLISIERFV